jgi:fructose-bisphosphate aldolase class I
MAAQTSGHKFQKELIETARKICTPGKGILAADESSGTIEKRLASIKVENTEENRRAYREMLFGAEGLNEHVSGVILFEETLMKHGMANGPSFSEFLTSKGIVVGIKVDKGIKTLAGTNGETTTQGHDDLDARCAAYYKQGARFAKWRAVLKIGANEPSELAIQENARGLARYAVICQENGLVPIVEPEILMDGSHTIERCAWVSEKVFAAVYKALNDHNVLLEGSLLKPNMILPGAECTTKSTAYEAASYTIRCLQRTVPAAVPGIVFLSGGQGEEEATQHLNAMGALKTNKPWFISFSFARALQSTAIKIWAGKAENVQAARDALLVRVKANGQAQQGLYTASGSLDAAATVSLFEKDYRY